MAWKSWLSRCALNGDLPLRIVLPDGVHEFGQTPQLTRNRAQCRWGWRPCRRPTLGGLAELCQMGGIGIDSTSPFAIEMASSLVEMGGFRCDDRRSRLRCQHEAQADRVDISHH